MASPLLPLRASGHTVAWTSWDGEHLQEINVTWENEGWTVVGNVGRERIQYVIRLNALWHPRQFLLFRDLDEPDLWLGTDGAGRWGEVNGAHRPELDGCFDLDLDCTPLTNSLPIRRLPLDVGDSATIDVALVDPETLDVRRVRQCYRRDASRHWTRSQLDDRSTVYFDVDDYGLVLDVDNEWRRAV